MYAAQSLAVCGPVCEAKVEVLALVTNVQYARSHSLPCSRIQAQSRLSLLIRSQHLPVAWVPQTPCMHNQLLTMSLASGSNLHLGPQARLPCADESQARRVPAQVCSLSESTLTTFCCCYHL